VKTRKMQMTGSVGIILLAGIGWLAYHTYQLHQTPPAPVHAPAVEIAVGPAKPLYSDKQKSLYAVVEHLLADTAKTKLDASGFVQYVYAQVGISLPRTIIAQSTVGTTITSARQLERGDVVFFNLNNGSAAVSFDGIYLGGDQFAAVTTHGLMTIKITDNYWADRFQFGKRVL